MTPDPYAPWSWPRSEWERKAVELGRPVYRGRQISWMLSADAGGGYAAYAHAFAPYFGDHIPGKPNIVIRHMPGGGGLRAMNWLFAVAPRDGTTIGLVHSSVPFAPLYRIQGAAFDPRQMGCTVDAYTKALGGSASGLKIGVVKEGFGHPQSEKVVDELVKKAAAKFKELGATVEEVSIPWHLTGMAVWSAIAVEGATWQMMLGNGYGFNWKGLYVTSLVDAHSAWRERADELSDTLKTTILFGKYALNKYRGHYYAKAQNLARKLGAAYDTALAKYDLLLMPTLPLRATKLPDPAGPRMDIINRAFEMLPNTAPFDVTGHPAITLPCGMSEGLPAGMMMIGKHWNESTIYKAADAYEKSHDWKKVTA